MLETNKIRLMRFSFAKPLTLQALDDALLA